MSAVAISCSLTSPRGRSSVRRRRSSITTRISFLNSSSDRIRFTIRSASSLSASGRRDFWSDAKYPVASCAVKALKLPPASEMSRVYSNFVHILKPGEKPESAAPKFSVYSGMDLPYWQEFYLLGEAEAVAERIRGKIAALGGVDHLILNPLDWDPASIEVLAERVLPLVAAP